jgi:hypothetical protein
MSSGMSPEDQALMDAVFDALDKTFPTNFKATHAPTEGKRVQNQAHWMTHIREAGLSPKEIMAALKRIALGERPRDAKGNKASNAFAPSLPEFIEMAQPDRGMLGHASRRPASEVLMEHYGTPKAALLGHQGESANERRLRVGREHIAMLKASF